MHAMRVCVCVCVHSLGIVHNSVFLSPRTSPGDKNKKANLSLSFLPASPFLLLCSKHGDRRAFISSQPNPALLTSHTLIQHDL